MQLLFIVLVFGFGFLEDARAEDVTRAKLIQRIGELFDQRRFQEGIPLGEELVTLTKAAHGNEDSETAASVDRLASLYESADDYVRAEPLRQEVLAIRQKVLGRDHPDTIGSLRNLAGLYEKIHRYTLAEPLLKDALEIRQKRLGLEHLDTAISLNA
jgi:tetratricopeptide (TPR) repeat protein